MWRGLILLLALSACAQFPELEGTVPVSVQGTNYPDLVPLEPLLTGARDVPRRNADTEQTLVKRVAALRSRATALQRPVVDSGTRARMRRGVAPI